MTAVAATEPSVPMTSEELRRIPLPELYESPLNPRIQYDAAALEELAGSLLASGQLTPIIVRPRKGGGYELAAGHRRRRAAMLACKKSPEGAKYRGLDALLAVIRPLSEREFIEVLNIENLQRDDLHPLEEAQGFRDLMEKAGYDVAKIAARIGRSTRYVYDSLTLLKLSPEAKKRFLDGGFERGHAVELARLTPEWQKRALNPEDTKAWAVGGLFQDEQVEVDPNAPKQEQLRLEDAVKPVSVREFKTWVNEKVRVTPATDADPMLFPQTAAALGQAILDKEKVVEITYEYMIPDEARDPKAPKIYSARAWRSATKGRVSPDVVGTSRAGAGKSCEHSVTGVIVIGEGCGDAFQVCIAKEKCAVHWGDWQRARAKKPRATTGSAEQRQNSHEAEQARWRREEEKRAAENKRWLEARPVILKAVVAKIAVAPAGPTSALANDILAACSDGKPKTAVPRGRTLEDLIRHAAFQLYQKDVQGLRPGFYRHADSLKNIRALGIDAAKIVDQVEPKAQPAIDPKKATCPQCGAKPGSPCKRPSGHTVFGGGFHAGRGKPVAKAAKKKARG